MGWEVGFDEKWKRDIGYGVPAICDHPGCDNVINRGLSFVCCKEEPYGGEDGCGLYFCNEHSDFNNMCECCRKGLGETFTPTHDIQEWIDHKGTHSSWAKWRKENKIK